MRRLVNIVLFLVIAFQGAHSAAATEDPMPALGQKITVTTPVTGAAFGSAVAAMGYVMMAGAPATGAGSVSAFVGNQGLWTQTQQITASDGSDSDGFGGALALGGPAWYLAATTLVVGASNSGSGSAYVYSLNAGVWVEQQKITPPDAAPGQQFGLSLALDGNTLLVGSPCDGSFGACTGAVYVYSLINGMFVLQQKLAVPTSAPGTGFGTSVAVKLGWAVVGAPQSSGSGATGAGLAYIYQQLGASWIQAQEVIAPDGTLGDQFGAAVALSDWQPSVGGTYFVVGAPNQSGAFGAVYQYTCPTNQTQWSYQHKLMAPDAHASQNFGSALTLLGNRVYVGTSDDNAASAASAYTFKFRDGSWSMTRQFSSPTAISGDHFGAALAVNGDTLFIGAPQDSDGGTGSGAVHVAAPLVAPVPALGPGGMLLGTLLMGSVGALMLIRHKARRAYA